MWHLGVCTELRYRGAWVATRKHWFCRWLEGEEWFGGFWRSRLEFLALGNLGSPGRVQGMIKWKNLTHLFAPFNIKLTCCYFCSSITEGWYAFLWKLSSGTVRSRSSCFVPSTGGMYQEWRSDWCYHLRLIHLSFSGHRSCPLPVVWHFPS